MYVFRTPEFSDAVTRYPGLKTLVDDLCAKVETADTLFKAGSYFDHHAPYIKRRFSNYRVLAKPIDVDGIQIIVLLKVFVRGDKAYDIDFANDPRGFGERNLEPLIHLDEVRLWLVERQAADQERTQAGLRRESLSNTAQAWLTPVQWGIDTADEVMIYESGEWMQAFRAREISDFWQQYFHIIGNQVVSGGGDETLEHPALRVASQEGRAVAFVPITARITVDTGEAVIRNLVLLLRPFKSAPTTENLAVLVQQWRTLLDSLIDGGQPDLDRVAPFARRAYPSFILADEQMWLDIEREEEANLALSVEEERALSSMAGNQSDSGLPAFINGRAGSGKSTMLPYLFADYCFRWQREELEGAPIYLTYSGQLLEVARTNVEKLLTRRPTYRLAEDFQIDRAGLGQCFRRFQEFLIDLLPIEKRERFSQDRYISYSRFKRLLRQEALSDDAPPCRLREGKSWSPEIVWHIIRAFVKGYEIVSVQVRWGRPVGATGAAHRVARR
jgi:hypothetical protein